MKILLDACVWGGAVEPLTRSGLDVVWAGDWPSDPGDVLILGRAYTEDRILVTLDKDFGDLAVLRQKPHCGIVRLVNIPTRYQAWVCLHVVRRYGPELRAGAIITAEPGRVRIRPGDKPATPER